VSGAWLPAFLRLSNNACRSLTFVSRTLLSTTFFSSLILYSRRRRLLQSKQHLYYMY
jgi:hypothetical protein